MTHVFRNQTQNMMAEASQLQHGFDTRNSSGPPGKQADDESGIVVSKFSLTSTNIL